MVSNKNKYKNSILIFICCSLTIITLFHSLFFSGFNLLLGDRFDALIQTNLLQHWYNVFTGNSRWDVVGYFYPFENTLGYNDGYFLFGFFYTLYRILGFDIFLSTDLVNITIKIIGFYSFWYLSKKTLKLDLLSSLVGAVIFTLANSMSEQMTHAQLLTIAFSPLLTSFIIGYLKSLKENNRSSAVKNGFLASLLLALWLFTSYYMAWFYIFFLTISLFVFILICLFSTSLRNTLRFKPNLPSLLIPVVCFLIFIIPFLNVYLPKAKETGGQPLYAVEYYAPSFFNIIDPGTHNLLFGTLSDKLFGNLDTVIRNGEFNIGFAPISIIITLAFFIYTVFKNNGGIERIFVISLCSALFISLSLVVKQGDFFLWKFVWQFFPGAKGMRVTARYVLFLLFPLSLIIAYFIHAFRRNANKYLLMVLCTLLVLEQVNLAPNARFNRKIQNDFVKSLPAPPSECKAFYVVGQRLNEFPVDNKNIYLNLYPHNVDAMLISEIFKLRTVNGFSSFNPPGWIFEKDPLPTYMLRVNKYIYEHDIRDGMCEFDLEKLRWTYFPTNSPFGIASRVFDKIDFKLKSENYHHNSDSLSFEVELTNNSDFNVGSDTYRPLRIGVRLFSAENKLIQQDYMHIDIPKLKSHGGKGSVIINLPTDFDKSDYLEVVPLEEGIAWFDWLGSKPLVLHAK